MKMFANIIEKLNKYIFCRVWDCRVWDVHKVYEDLEGIIIYKSFSILYGLHLQVRGIKNIYLTIPKAKLNVSYTAF